MARKRKAERGVQGNGSVYPWDRRRKDGSINRTWVAAVIYRDQDGRPNRLVAYAKSSDEASERLKELQSRPEVRERIAPAKGTVGEFISTWLTTVIEPNLRSSTFTTYRTTIRSHIEPHAIASLPLSKVTSSSVDALYAKLVKSGVTPRTRLKVHDILSAAFTYARVRKQIGGDPMLGIKRPKYEAPSIKALTSEQIESLLEAAVGDPLEALYVVTIFTGLRQGEVLSLTWGSVDFETGILTVRTSLRDTGAVGKGVPKRVVGGPKTEGSSRPVALPARAVDALRRHREGATSAKPSDLVFPNQTGGTIWRNNLLRRSFYPLLERAGLYQDGKPMLTFHGLRHVHGTELFRAGVHPKVVQERLGHSRIGITLDTYSSSVPGIQQAAVDAIDRAYPHRV